MKCAFLVVPLLAPAAHAGIAYLNLPIPGPLAPGVASNVEFADDLILDLSQGPTVTSAFVRIVHANTATAPSVIRLSLYTDNAGRPGTLLTTAAVTISPGGPLAYDQLFDFPDVTLSGPNIWAGHVFEVMPNMPAAVGTGTLPTIGSTTARGATRLGPDSWNVQGADGPAPGGGYYVGDRLQISIISVPAPAAVLALPAALALRRRRATLSPTSSPVSSGRGGARPRW